MKFKIIGSGGCTATPKPLCSCNVCTTARTKGFPYARCGASLYLEDIALVVDTPEDITQALNNGNVAKVDNILYSHWDPDHTLGMRVVEQLRIDWRDFSPNKKPKNPVNIYATQATMADINQIANKFGSFLDYYENVQKLIQRHVVTDSVTIDDIKITFVPVPGSPGVSVFVFESLATGKRLVYSPCDAFPFPVVEEIKGADILIVGGNLLLTGKDSSGQALSADHPIFNEFYTFEQVQALQQSLQIPQMIITHIEEIDGKTYDELLEYEKTLPGITFAWDGMEVAL